MDAQAGRFNVYNLLDTCGRDSASARRSRWARCARASARRRGRARRPRAAPRAPRASTRRRRARRAARRGRRGDGRGRAVGQAVVPVRERRGADAFLGAADVMAALHVSGEKAGMRYASTQGDLQPLYRELARKYRLVIFGDVDMCVPFVLVELTALNFTGRRLARVDVGGANRRGRRGLRDPLRDRGRGRRHAPVLLRHRQGRRPHGPAVRAGLRADPPRELPRVRFLSAARAAVQLGFGGRVGERPWRHAFCLGGIWGPGGAPQGSPRVYGEWGRADRCCRRVFIVEGA